MTFHIFLFVFCTPYFFFKYHYSRDLFIVHIYLHKLLWTRYNQTLRELFFNLCGPRAYLIFYFKQIYNNYQYNGYK